VYCELAKANGEYVEKIQAATTAETLKSIWTKMKETGYLNYKINIATIDANAADFEALSLDDQKRFLIECLDKNLLYVPFSDIDSEEYAISDEDKRLTREFYTKI
jgi:adenine-specific DNA-methyltransferase